MTGWLLWIGLAAAGGFYLEAPPVDARAQAVELQAVAQELDLDARVLRRYRHGSGWEFVVVIEGFDAREGAEQAAEKLAERSGQGIAVYRLEGDAAVPVEADPTPAEPAMVQLPQASELLQRAARSLGGPAGGHARLESAAALVFVYTRSVMTPDATLTARHAWSASGDRRRVAIDVAEGGQGVSSVVGSGPDGSWVATQGQVRDALAPQAAAVLMDLSPMARLAWPLQLAARLDSIGPYRVARQEMVAGRSCWVLVATAASEDQPSRIWLDTEHARPARVDFATEAGRVELTLSDWREPDTGVVVPYLLELRRDGRLIERIEVVELTLDPDLPDALFQRPGAD